MEKRSPFSALVIYLLNVFSMVACFLVLYQFGEINARAHNYPIERHTSLAGKIGDSKSIEALRITAIALNDWITEDQLANRRAYRFAIPCLFLAVVALTLNSGIWAFLVKNHEDPLWMNRKGFVLVIAHAAIVLVFLILVANEQTQEVEPAGGIDSVPLRSTP
ncbi:MAG: hypothetical protein PHF70_06150 [Opitutales bacterium]|nr:hypothetical protein [Opitutales bacterium]